MEIDWSAPATSEEAAEADHCGHLGEKLMHDPFIAEIDNEISWRWLCDGCEDDRRMDV